MVTPLHHLPIARQRVGTIGSQPITDTDVSVNYETFSPSEAQIGEFRAATDALAPRLGAPHPFFINGEARDGGEREHELAPHDRRIVVGRFAASSLQDFDEAVAAAKAFQPVWARTPWQERTDIVRRVAALVIERRFELAAILAYEIGKPLLEALGEVDELVALIDYYADHMTSASGFTSVLSDKQAERTLSVMRPHGVWVVIGPFNFPMALALGPIAAALIAGNTAVFKPSPAGYLSGAAIYDLFHDAGVPTGALHMVTIPDNLLGDRIYTHPAVDGLTFTGSHETGMRVYRGFLKDYPRPIVCEMGGKNPALVSAKANLEKAALGVSRSAFGFSGQRCSACSRVFVATRGLRRLRRIPERFSEPNAGVEPGRPDGAAGSGDLPRNRGPVRRRGGGKRRRRREIHGGRVLDDADLSHGNFVEPTVAEVEASAPVLRDELFAPFVAVRPMASLVRGTRARQLARVRPDRRRLLRGRGGSRAVPRLDPGGSRVLNRAAGATTGAWPGVQPFGGWKGSGGGRGAGGPFYLQQYLREQSRTIVGDDVGVDISSRSSGPGRWVSAPPTS